jgi:hypothetical protein
MIDMKTGVIFVEPLAEIFEIFNVLANALRQLSTIRSYHFMLLSFQRKTMRLMIRYGLIITQRRHLIAYEQEV